jgi:hypothetical protein
MKKILIAATFTLSAAIVMAQGTAYLIVPRSLHLPKDSAVRAGLLASLEGWLGQRSQPDSMNVYVAHEAATSVFMDELRSIDRLIRRDSAACHCYLGNVVPLDSVRCMVQLNYIEMRKDTPVLRACCRVLAQKGDNNRWMMSSVLKENTVGWKTTTIGNCVFHYQNVLNEKKAADFVRQIGSYDKRLNAAGTVFDFYSCANALEATRLVGEDYRIDYNGSGYYDLSADYGNRTVVVSGDSLVDGFNDWNRHDWWHGRLHRVVPVATIYRPVDEGMAYLYGGSWQVYGWKDVLRLFREYATAHPDADWLALYKSGVDYVPGPHNLRISYVINALIVQRLGFDAALPLVTCGPKQDGDLNYFAALKKVTGVDEAGFNAYVADLLVHAVAR